MRHGFEVTVDRVETGLGGAITAVVVKAILIPASSSSLPKMPRLPNAIRSPMPPTAGGSTIGRSISASITLRPGKVPRDSM
jgi:hypothetical protein